MALATACFKWMDLLETQFDKSWIELDSLLLPLEEDEDFSFMYTKTRRHTASLASCFSQLSHKASVVFQNNAKLEAELLHLREELATTKVVMEKTSQEKLYLAKALQDSLAKNHKIQHSENGDIVVSSDNTTGDNADIKDISSNTTKLSSIRDSEVCTRLLAENERLRTEVVELESEMIGARLDNVYLDKELAGRIQQIQLLLASNTPGDVKEKMWTQIESEMCLQRSKTIAQMCRTKQEVKAKLVISEPATKVLTKSAETGNGHVGTHSQGDGEGVDKENNQECQERRGKQVMVLKNPADDLGMAILGGKDHNLPIIISEIFPNSALSRCSRIQAGDIICSVNDEDFSKKTHKDAVNFLSSLRGQIHFDLISSEDVSEDDPSNLDYRFYKLFHPYVVSKNGEGDVNDEISNITPSHPGRAISVNDGDIKGAGKEELPSVHSSPKKET